MSTPDPTSAASQVGEVVVSKPEVRGIGTEAFNLLEKWIKTETMKLAKELERK